MKKALEKAHDIIDKIYEHHYNRGWNDAFSTAKILLKEQLRKKLDQKEIENESPLSK